MIEALLGKKIGMTHLFGDEARVVPVTVLQVGPCVVTQIRTTERDGYAAAQIGFGEAKSLNKPAAGHQAAANTRLRTLREVPVLGDEVAVGETITVRQFQPGDVVDVIAIAKGRGFQGVVKRHGYAGGPKTHGQGDRQRATGSIGAGTSPGHVIKGKTMPGHMGDNRVTVRHLKVEKVDADRNLLMIRGAVPGARNGTVLVRFSRGLPVAERVVVESAPEAEPAQEKES